MYNKTTYAPICIRKFQLAYKPSVDVDCKVQIELCSRRMVNLIFAFRPNKCYYCHVKPETIRVQLIY